MILRTGRPGARPRPPVVATGRGGDTVAAAMVHAALNPGELTPSTPPCAWEWPWSIRCPVRGACRFHRPALRGERDAAATPAARNRPPDMSALPAALSATGSATTSAPQSLVPRQPAVEPDG